MRVVRVFAPATVANVAVGFDLLGFAIDGIGETIEMERIDGRAEIIIEEVPGYPDLPRVPVENTATAGLVQLISDMKLNFGFRIRIKKEIPIGSGLGGSAASAVAGIFAANQFLKKKLKPPELLHYALLGEEVASHALHADNVAPCLHGGLVFAGPAPEFRIHRIRTPKSLACAVLLPDLQIKTSESRGQLKRLITLAQHVEQSANLVGFLMGCVEGDFDLMRRFLRDVIIEPQRAPQIPGFDEFKYLALKCGALGCSISGSGPAIFALTENMKVAKRVELEWRKQAKMLRVPIRGTWSSAISKRGARLLPATKKAQR